MAAHATGLEGIELERLRERLGQLYAILEEAAAAVAPPAPGEWAPAVLGLALRPRLRRVYSRSGVHRALRLTPDNITNLRRAAQALGAPDGRAAFFASLRGVIEPRGQRGSFIEMRQLAEHVPTLIIWNEGDPVLPVAHARAAHAYLPGSRLVVFEGSGHEPHRREATRFADTLADFIASQ